MKTALKHTWFSDHRGAKQFNRCNMERLFFAIYRYITWSKQDWDDYCCGRSRAVDIREGNLFGGGYGWVNRQIREEGKFKASPFALGFFDCNGE